MELYDPSILTNMDGTVKRTMDIIEDAYETGVDTASDAFDRISATAETTTAAATKATTAAVTKAVRDTSEITDRMVDTATRSVTGLPAAGAFDRISASAEQTVATATNAMEKAVRDTSAIADQVVDTATRTVTGLPSPIAPIAPIAPTTDQPKLRVVRKILAAENPPPPPPANSPVDDAPSSPQPPDPIVSVSYDIAVSRFFELKGDYEARRTAFKKKVRSNKIGGVAEQRRRIAAFTPKCIGCGKKGGTEFTIATDSLTATCLAGGCSLNIEIHRTNVLPIQSVIDDIINDDIRRSKDLVLSLKNQIAFSSGDTTSLMDEIEEEIEAVKFGIEERETIIRLKLDMTDGTEADRAAEQKLAEAYSDVLGQMQVLVDKAEEVGDSGDTHLVADMIELYNTRLVPITEQRRSARIRRVKFSHSNMEVDAKNFEPVDAEDGGRDSRVVSFST
jgi:hypothetical protein